MNPSWMSLLPPILVLVCGFATHRVLLSLGLGIISASLIAAHFSVIDASILGWNYFWTNTEIARLQSWNSFWTSKHLFIGLFLIILGILVTLLSHSGGAHAYGTFIKKYLKTKKSAESSSVILSSLLFVDDYFSSLTVGAVMHPITDMFKIPRVKLAFLVDAMAAPIAIIAPISSWVPVILSQLSESGISTEASPSTSILADPFVVYSGMIPFMFYSFFIISACWFIIGRGISFGSMKKHEDIALKTGNVFGNRKDHLVQTLEIKHPKSSSMIDFLVPISTLFTLVLVFILYTGGYSLFGGTRTLLDAFQHTKADLALFLGGGITFIFSCILFLYRGKIKPREIAPVIVSGTRIMTPALLILLFSWTLGDLLREHLYTGHYLASLLVGSIDVTFFPVMFFITAAITSFATGSSWGTIAIIFPIAVPMLVSFLKLPTPAPLSEVPLLFPLLGAIASGAVFGDHISPISDTTIMASTSTGSHHIDHVNTQMTYAIPVFVATGLSFLLAGILATKVSFWINVGSCCLVGIASAFVILEVMNRIFSKR